MLPVCCCLLVGALLSAHEIKEVLWTHISVHVQEGAEKSASNYVCCNYLGLLLELLSKDPQPLILGDISDAAANCWKKDDSNTASNCRCLGRLSAIANGGEKTIWKQIRFHFHFQTKFAGLLIKKSCWFRLWCGCRSLQHRLSRGKDY